MFASMLKNDHFSDEKPPTYPVLSKDGSNNDHRVTWLIVLLSFWYFSSVYN